MKIIEINSSDIPGHIFNGYDLHRILNENRYIANMIVLQKYSDAKTVHGLMQDAILHSQIQKWEWEHSVSHVMIPYGYKIKQMKLFKEADIIHCHILHNHMISLFDYPELLGLQGSIWTIHDPWIFTGNCIHPLECTKWKTGCGSCDRLHNDTFDMLEDNTAFIWDLKKSILKNINPHIVVASEFMKKYVQTSPITGHFDKIDIIPFGIDTAIYDKKSKIESKEKFNIPHGKIVIGFRADDFFIKGCEYLYKALLMIEQFNDVCLLCVGNGTIPHQVKQKFHLIELGWINDENKMIEFWKATDIFVMPSLAEGFGVMSIEAMASGCAVICFKGTVIAENTNAPDCGLQADYKSAESLSELITYLLNNPYEIKHRGMYGRYLAEKKYRFSEYVRRHIALYERVHLNTQTSHIRICSQT